MDADGRPVDSDMRCQINLSFDNLETVLQQANYSLADVVRLNFHIRCNGYRQLVYQGYATG